jgi:integrase
MIKQRNGQPVPRRRHSAEFKSEALGLAERVGVTRAAKQLGLHESPDEVAAVRAAAGGDFGLYLDLLIQTGARPSEGLHLTWEDVGPDWVVLRTRKTARGDRLPRRVRIGAGLAADLEARRAAANGGRYVFGQAGRDAPHHYVWPRKQHLAACARAGVRPFPVGCYRHHHAVELYRQTRDLLAAQERLGHADAKTTQHYLRSLLSR